MTHSRELAAAVAVVTRVTCSSRCSPPRRRARAEEAHEGSLEELMERGRDRGRARS